MLSLLASLAFAGSLAGVTLPDKAEVGGQTVTLNGMGLREKYFIDVYVGALYMQHPTHDGKAAIAANEPKRIVMHFIYEVPREKLLETFRESVGAQAEAAAVTAETERLYGWMPEVMKPGEQIVLDYVPGTGTTVKVKGRTMGTIPGETFGRVIWTVYLGPKPPTEAVKAGMLGG